MTQLGFRVLAFLIAIAVFTTTAAAQTTSNDDWLLVQHMKPRKTYIVTTADPTQRHRCRVTAQDEKSITCSRAFGRSLTYQRDDVEAVIVGSTGVHHSWGSLGGVGIFGAIGYGLYTLGGVGIGGLVAASALALPVAMMFLFVLLVINYDDDTVARQPEAVVYVKPGTTYKSIHA